MKHSGMFALSEPGKLEEVIAAAGLKVDEDDEIDSLIVFDDTHGAVRAFVGGPDRRRSRSDTRVSWPSHRRCGRRSIPSPTQMVG